VWEEVALGAEVYQNVYRWYETGTARYSRRDPLGVIRPHREALFTANHLYTYAASSPTFFIDPLGLRVIIEDGGVQESYDQLKGCFRFFRVLMTNFEVDTNFFGRPVDWHVKTPTWFNPTCQARGLRGEGRTVWVPPDLECEDMMRCLLHEFYELWLLEFAGFTQHGASGPADDRARRAESWIPMGDCCPCPAGNGNRNGGTN
jgi:RHS repeat-associated protein